VDPDLLLFYFEGCARSLSCLPQLMDGGVFLLTGIAKLLV
jgi:hypothetical protein